MKIILDYKDDIPLPIEKVFVTAIEISAKAKIPVCFRHENYEVFVTAELKKEGRIK